MPKIWYNYPLSTQKVNLTVPIIAKSMGDLIDSITSYMDRLSYAKFFEETTGRNPLKCGFCGAIMELWQLYHPDKGIIYDLEERLINGKNI